MKKTAKETTEKKNRIIALALAQKDLQQVEGGHVPLFPNDTCTNDVDCD
jgi:hypothetical protein